MHAEIFNLLGDATGDPVLARVAGLAVGWTHDLAVRVGPVADSIILNSRRRLLDFLSAGDADGAAREMERHLSGLCFMGGRPRAARNRGQPSTSAGRRG